MGIYFTNENPEHSWFWAPATIFFVTVAVRSPIRTHRRRTKLLCLITHFTADDEPAGKAR